MGERFTALELQACAAREVRQRRRVYPGLVARERMSQHEMDRQIAMMEQIAEEYGEKAKAEAPQKDMFGGA